jgi:predicted transcriptional regulator of viral defense system
VFTKDDVVSIVGKSKRAAALLHNYQSRGVITKVRRNMYCILNLGTGEPDITKWQIGSAISSTSAIAYHSALEYHGFAHQLFFEIAVISSTRFNPINFNGISYVYYSNRNPVGIIHPQNDPMVRITDMERTIIDCIDRIDLCGGSEELFNSLSAIRFVSEERLLNYLSSIHKSILYSKVGFVLSNFSESLHLSKDFFEVCHQYGKKSVGTLTTSDSCTKFIKEWGLYVPLQIINTDISEHATI